MWFDIGLLFLTFVVGIMLTVYFWFGTARIEEEIGVGYTRKHMRLWFSIAVIEFMALWYIYLFGV